MTDLTATPNQLLLKRDQLANALAPHLRTIVLACMAAASLLVWSAPGAVEARCILASQAPLVGKSAVALSLSVTALAWYFHKPLGQRFSALRDRIMHRS